MISRSGMTPQLKRLIKRMDPDKLYRYQKMAQSLYDKANDPNPHTINMEVAAQIRLMLRDGLHPDMLEENERQIYIDAYGLVTGGVLKR